MIAKKEAMRDDVSATDITQAIISFGNTLYLYSVEGNNASQFIRVYRQSEEENVSKLEYI